MIVRKARIVNLFENLIGALFIHHQNLTRLIRQSNNSKGVLSFFLLGCDGCDNIHVKVLKRHENHL